MANLKLGALYNKLQNKAVNKRRKENEKYFTQKARAEQSNRHYEAKRTRKNLKSSSGSRKAVGAVKGFTSGLSFVPVREDKNESFGDYRYKQYAPTAAYNLAESVNKDRAKTEKLLNRYKDYKSANVAGNVAGTIAGAMLTSGATKAAAGKVMGTKTARKLTDKLARKLIRATGEKAASKSAGKMLLRKALARAAQNNGLVVNNKNIGRMAESAIRGLASNVAQDVAYDTTFGAAKDVSRYVASGKSPTKNKKDFAKYMLKNAGANLLYGAIGNAILPAAKQLKKGKQYYISNEVADDIPNRQGNYGTHVEKVANPTRSAKETDMLKDTEYLNYMRKNGIDGKSVRQVAREKGESVLDVLSENYGTVKKRIKDAAKKAAEEKAKDTAADNIADVGKAAKKAKSVAKNEVKEDVAETVENTAKETTGKKAKAKADEYTPYVNEYAIGAKYGTDYIKDSPNRIRDILPFRKPRTAEQWIKKNTVEGTDIEYAKTHNMTPSDVRAMAKDRIAESLGYRKLTADERKAVLTEYKAKEAALQTPTQKATNEAMDVVNGKTPAKSVTEAVDAESQIARNNAPEYDASADMHANYRQHTTEGKGTSKSAESVQQFVARQNKELGDELDEYMTETGSSKRFTESNPDALKNAGDNISRYGEQATYQNIRRNVSDGGGLSDEEIAEGLLLNKKWIEELDEARAAGNAEKAKYLQDNINGLAAHLKVGMSANGRGMQAAKLLQQATPEARDMSVRVMASRLSKMYDVDLELDPDLMAMLKRARNEQDINEIQDAIAINIWDQIPGSINEKFGGYRYLSMLLNPRTHIRNILGNAGFTPVRGVRDRIEAGIQTALDKQIKGLGGKRTKAIINPASKTYKSNLNGAVQEWDMRKPEFYSNTNKFNLSQHRPGDSSAYMGRLSGLYKANSKALNVEDEWCAAPAFQKSFARYMEANKLDYATATREQIDEAVNFAYQEAVTATYREKNALAAVLNKARRSAHISGEAISKMQGMKKWETLIEKGAGIGIDTISPFTNTPANILKTGAVDFNPAQLAHGAYQMLRHRTAQELLDGIHNISNGITGLGLYGLGMYLAHKGIARASSDGSNQAYYDKDKGYQDYSFTIGKMKYGAGELLDLLSAGRVDEALKQSDDKVNFTMDWAMPEGLPLFMGVEGYNAIEKAFQNEDANTGENLLKALGYWLESMPKMAEPIFEMSMLSSVSNVFDTSKAEKHGLRAPTQIGLNIADSRFGQYTPTALRQTSNVLAGARHNTGSTETGMAGYFESLIRRQADKIPVLSNKINPNKSDALGNLVKGKKDMKDYALSALENYISPANVRSIRNEGIDKEVQNLLDRGAEADKVIPQTSWSGMLKTQYAGKEIKASINDLEFFNQTRGRKIDKEATKLFKSKEYKKASTSERADMLKKVYDDASDYANEKLARSKGFTERDILRGDSKYRAKENSMKYQGMNGKTYAKVYKHVGKTIDLLKERDINSGSNASYIAKALAAKEKGVRNIKQAKVAISKELTDDGWKRVVALSKRGFTAKQCVSYALDKKQKQNLKSKGNNIDKNKLYLYINSMDIPQNEKWARWEVNRYNRKGWENPF